MLSSFPNRLLTRIVARVQGARSASYLPPEPTLPSIGGGSLNVLDRIMSFDLGLPTSEFEPLQLDKIWEDLLQVGQTRQDLYHRVESPATSEPMSPEYLPEKESAPLFLASIPAPFFAAY